MLSRQLSLALVDDHTLFRKTLKNFLSEQANIHVSLQAPDVFDLLDKLRKVSIDILVMDIFLPQLNANEALKMIRHEHLGIKILILSVSTDMDLISDLLEEGIHGYISKADEPEELLQAIQVVSENRIYRNKVFTKALYWLKQNSFKPVSQDAKLHLNDREKKVLQLLWEEKSNKEIANELYLGIRSVEKIRQDMKEKIGAKSTVGLLKYALQKKIISINSYHSSLSGKF